MKNLTNAILILLILSISTSCSRKYTKISDDTFIGIWEITGATILDGIQIKIQKENNQLIGKIYKLNDNKFVKIFADSNSVWISEIKRSSNFEFKLTENKIAKELFSLYGQKTSQEFNVQFIDDNTIGFAMENGDPQKATRIYKRISGNK